MTTTANHEVLEPLPGYRSIEAGLFVAQLDELTGRLLAHVDGATPEELAWQPAPGTNTIGMLLAHIAIVEVFWIQIALGRTEFATEDSLGINIDDDGMPIADGALPPANLAGKDLAYYLTLIGKGREYVKNATRGFGERELEREVTRTQGDGKVRTVNLRWIYYHLVEHLGGHYGQINLLRHLYRTRRA